MNRFNSGAARIIIKKMNKNGKKDTLALQYAEKYKKE
jgi:hypothetical protein